MSLLLATAMAWLPAIGSGPSGEFLLRSDAPNVIGIISNRLDGNAACYFQVETATPAVYIRKDSTRSWVDGVTGGDRCKAAVEWEGLGAGAAMRLRVEFLGDWAGAQTIYLLERPGAQWYRAGVWTVTGDTVPWLPPVSVAGPPGKEGSIGPRGFPGDIGPKGLPGINGDTLMLSVQRVKMAFAGDSAGAPEWVGPHGLVFRNGLFQIVGADYSYDGTRLKALGPAWSATDTVYVLVIQPSLLTWTGTAGVTP